MRNGTTATRDAIVIVGAGLAGATAADELRRRGFGGSLVLIGDEDELPYDRPPLSKGFLRGDTPRRDVLLHDGGFYAERDVELLTGTRVLELDLRASQVVLADQVRMRFEKLLLATGAEGAPPPGTELEGVHVLRTLDESERLREELLAAERALVIGGGWLGSEVVAVARELGARVTLAVRGEAPLARHLGPELGTVYDALHRGRGAEVLAKTEVVALEGDSRVRAARTRDGRRLEADVVVFAGGARARADLAKGAGLPVEGGVLVDEQLRTRAERVFAAGDVAYGENAFYGVRIQTQHWDNAIGQGEAAAAAMLGQGRPYDRIPHIFSDQYDSQLAYYGFHTARPTVIREALDTDALLAFWQDAAGRVVAAAELNFHAGGHGHVHGDGHGDDHANGHDGGGDATHDHGDAHDDDRGHGHPHGREAAALQALIRARTPVVRERLSDPTIPLSDLIPDRREPAAHDTRRSAH